MAWTEAREIAARIGAGPLLDEIEGLGRRARLLSSPSGDAYGLTPREREVLALLARGRSDGQIAAELFISPKTASVHVSNIKGKLGVEHRIEAAAMALKLGLAEWAE